MRSTLSQIVKWPSNFIALRAKVHFAVDTDAPAYGLWPVQSGDNPSYGGFRNNPEAQMSDEELTREQIAERLAYTGWEDFPPLFLPEWFLRFADKVERRGATECWPWRSNRLPAGYGQLAMGGRGGVPKYAHRLAYELWRGPIPEGLNVCHSCDNPGCVNPAHLWLGTQADNLKDRHAKGWYLHQREKAE